MSPKKTDGSEEPKVKLTARDIIEFAVIPILTIGCFILWDLSKGINNLNVQVGVLIANNSTNEKRVDGLESNMTNLEERINRRLEYLEKESSGAIPSHNYLKGVRRWNRKR